MRENRLESWTRVHNVGIAVLLGLLAFFAPRANAAPFTDNFVNLISDLQSRAATLSNSTDKVEKKEFTTIQSVLKTLEGKNSTSLATDISNLGSVDKALAKEFPDDATFGADLETALEGLVGDVQTGLDATQTTLDGLGDTACATKAQTALDGASNQVVVALAATDFATASKLLGTALKSGLKVEIAAAKCSSTSGGGGSGGGTTSGDFMKATISGAFSLDFDAEDFVTATYGPSAGLFTIVGAVANFHGTAIDITVLNGVTVPGTYAIFSGSNLDRGSPSSDYGSANGTITFTTFDPTNQKAAGTFSFTATATNSAAITVSNGSFTVSKISIVQ